MDQIPSLTTDGLVIAALVIASATLPFLVSKLIQVRHAARRQARRAALRKGGRQ